MLTGVVEEVGSLIIVLRLFRVFKVSSSLTPKDLHRTSLTQRPQIIEELSAGAEEQMEPLHVRIQDLERANLRLEHEIEELKRGQETVP